MAVSDDTLRREFYAAALTGILASGRVVDISHPNLATGEEYTMRAVGVRHCAELAAVVADAAVLAWHLPKRG